MILYIVVQSDPVAEGSLLQPPWEGEDGPRESQSQLVWKQILQSKGKAIHSFQSCKVAKKVEASRKTIDSNIRYMLIASSAEAICSLKPL